jgi:hypothetical protein
MSLPNLVQNNLPVLTITLANVYFGINASNILSF